MPITPLASKKFLINLTIKMKISLSDVPKFSLTGF